MNIEKKLYDLSLLHCTENSKLYIAHLNNKIAFYEKQKQLLKKPSWFRRKSLKKYWCMVNEYNGIIVDLYKDIEREIAFMMDINK